MVSNARGRPLLDTTDLDILEWLYKASGKRSIKDQNITTLGNEIKVRHNNLKPHVDKLINLNLISVLSSDVKGNEKPDAWLITPKDAFDFMRENSEMFNKKDIEGIKDEYDYFLHVLHMLRKVKKGLDKKSNIDLRSKEGIDKVKINPTKRK